jgi:acyl-coenzyme A synthetase/AMP-(fatty) acid ligase
MSMKRYKPEEIVGKLRQADVLHSQGVPVLFAVLTADADSSVVEAAVPAAARALPGYKRPREIRFVAEIPRTATGKVRRFLLRQPGHAA